MSRPILQESITGASAAVQGEEFAGKGHVTWGLQVVAEGLNTAGGDAFTVRLEVEGENGEWSPVLDESDASVLGEITEPDVVDVDGDGTTYNGFVRVHGLPAPSVRAHLSTYTDGGSGFTVDAYVMGAGNAGTGSAYLSGSI
ncbi:hypothetical protein ACERIT_05055 [Halopenitus sp. H-Gu1]|uniref:hypothetical protein n=1 Tax=Halopenitus sp. H-Gu1 TaxID=3242697 RepID=UPI00359E33A9